MRWYVFNDNCISTNYDIITYRDATNNLCSCFNRNIIPNSRRFNRITKSYCNLLVNPKISANFFAANNCSKAVFYKQATTYI